tara:strand:+ start:415830 stop:417953 length:2124 start_codon:yes stop_codon:yes gene_type:complete
MKKTIFLLLLFFIIGSAVFSQENPRGNAIKEQLEMLRSDTTGLGETLNINITQTTLSNFLLAISKIHKLNINVAPELNSIPIVNNFSNVSVKDLLIFLVKEYDLDIDFTGNILSIRKYVAPKEEEAPINITYNPSLERITLDLKQDKLEKAFRKIMDETGKNLLFSPEIQNVPLTLYIKNVAIDVALDKLATTNNLTLSKSRDGFYLFDAAFSSGASADNGASVSRPRRNRRASFYYKVIDTVGRKVEVDFKNTPVADVIYTLSDDLNLDVFTATPLDNAGVATVKAESIDFDTLLDKIFQSAISSSGSETVAQGNSRNNSQAQPLVFTYKKEAEVYYFGTEDQLSLKQVEAVLLVNRSINVFSDPVRSSQSVRNQNFVTGNTSFNGTNAFNNGGNQNGASRADGVNQQNSKLESIDKIIPDDIKEGLDIKTDFELNSFIVSGPGVKVERFKEFVAQIDKAVPVIIIEVMILEVNRTAVVEAGVSFGLGEKPVQTQGAIFPSTDIQIGAETANKIIGSMSGFGSLNIGRVLPEFYLDIKAMEANGQLRIHSTPQLAALNGHKAYLSSGQTTYYTVTDQSFIGSQIPQTLQTVNFVPITAELALEIKPFVSGDGQITLDVQVIQSSFSSRIQEDAPPDINTREFSSIIRMQDQDTAVLGGIEQKIKDDSGSGVPLLSRIPVLKWLFSNRRREDSKKTLTVLIKPTVLR